MSIQKTHRCFREDPCSAPRGVLLGMMIPAALVLVGIGLLGCWLQIRAAFLSYPEAWLGLFGTLTMLAVAVTAGVHRFRAYREGWGVFVWISAAMLCIVISFSMMIWGQ